MEFVLCSLIIAIILALVVASVMLLIFGIQLLIDHDWFDGILSIILSLIILIVYISLAVFIFITFF